MRRLVRGLDRAGAITKRPPIWALVAAALVGVGGDRGRDAALRGGVAYGIAALLANVVLKPAFRRSRPAGSDQARIGPLTTSFPSGHAATDLAFVFGVSQRVPALFPPLAASTFAAHWSLVRTRAHHVTDILAGGAIGIGVAVAVGAFWPAKTPGVDDDNGEERLMTRIEGEDAQLLVHIERIDPDESDPSTPLPPDDAPGAGSPQSDV
ncbi:MAG: phosphatase PAP2 family protein [Acidimicrobiales bacterium]